MTAIQRIPYRHQAAFYRKRRRRELRPVGRDSPSIPIRGPEGLAASGFFAEKIADAHDRCGLLRANAAQKVFAHGMRMNGPRAI